MECKTLRLGDSGECVTLLQKWLNAYRKKIIPVDGVFDKKTRTAVQDFQKGYGLEADGVVGRYTWAELARHGFEPGVCLTPVDHTQHTDGVSALQLKYLSDFHGDTDWIHEWEGHKGRVYWPGGDSGVTLDPGVDLAYVDEKKFDEVWGPRLTSAQLAAAHAARRYKGRAAERWLKTSDAAQPLHAIRISLSEAKDIFPSVLSPYWTKITGRFPALLADFQSDNTGQLRGACHTVFLSLAFNRGTGNRALSVLEFPLKEGRYSTLGNLVAAMQQDHELEGIRRRRRAEGRLILDLL